MPSAASRDAALGDRRPPTLEALSELAGTLGPERWRAASDAAQALACYLVSHPRVREVRYPGLRSDSLFERAARALERGFGPIVCYRVAGEDGWRSVDCAKAGDVVSLVDRFEQELAR